MLEAFSLHVLEVCFLQRCQKISYKLHLWATFWSLSLALFQKCGGKFPEETFLHISATKLSCTLDKCRKISWTRPHWLHNKGKNCGQIFYCREKSSCTFVGIFPTHSMQSSKNSPQVKFIGALVANMLPTLRLFSYFFWNMFGWNTILSTCVCMYSAYSQAFRFRRMQTHHHVRYTCCAYAHPRKRRIQIYHQWPH